jgi:prepilin-type N-terminal cleavage/methylation domain-containing protein
VTALRHRLTAAGRDQGITLVELIVAMMILGIVLAVTSGTVLSLTRATSTARTVDVNVRESSNGMNALAQSIRSAVDLQQPSAADKPAFQLASAEALTVSTSVNFADTQAKPVLVTYDLDASRKLREVRTQSVRFGSSYWQFTGTSASRLLTAPVAAPAGTPLFVYLDKNRAALTPGSTGRLDDAQLRRIAFVQVTLAIKSTTYATDNGVTLVNTIGTPNLPR